MQYANLRASIFSRATNALRSLCISQSSLSSVFTIRHRCLNCVTLDNSLPYNWIKGTQLEYLPCDSNTMYYCSWWFFLGLTGAQESPQRTNRRAQQHHVMWELILIIIWPSIKQPPYMLLSSTINSFKYLQAAETSANAPPLPPTLKPHFSF